MVKHFGVRMMISALALAALAACSTPKITTDLTFLPQGPIPINSNFATFVGPGIWEVVPAGGRTYEGTIEYLVEALDANGNVVASYNSEATRLKAEVADERPALSELVTILIATQSQITTPVPLEWRLNPRYMIPPDASVVRITIDPHKKIEELDENNNRFIFDLPAIYSDL